MRDLDETDLLVLCALSLELHEAMDLLKWALRADHALFDHPAIQWWIMNYAPQVSAMLAKRWEAAQR